MMAHISGINGLKLQITSIIRIVDFCTEQRALNRVHWFIFLTRSSIGNSGNSALIYYTNNELSLLEGVHFTLINCTFVKLLAQ